MDDMDRATLEYGQESSGFEAEQFEFAQGVWSGEGGANAMFFESEEMELANERARAIKLSCTASDIMAIGAYAAWMLARRRHADAHGNGTEGRLVPADTDTHQRRGHGPWLHPGLELH